MEAGHVKIRTHFCMGFWLPNLLYSFLSLFVRCFFVVTRITVEKLKSCPPGHILIELILAQAITCNQLMISYNKTQTHLNLCLKPTTDPKLFMLRPVHSALHWSLEVYRNMADQEVLGRSSQMLFLTLQNSFVSVKLQENIQARADISSKPRIHTLLDFWRNSGLVQAVLYPSKHFQNPCLSC